MEIMQVHFKYFQVQTHVQTARESPDLNMDFRSFDNGCKQLYEQTSMQENNGIILRHYLSIDAKHIIYSLKRQQNNCT